MASRSKGRQIQTGSAYTELGDLMGNFNIYEIGQKYNKFLRQHHTALTTITERPILFHLVSTLPHVLSFGSKYLYPFIYILVGISRR